MTKTWFAPAFLMTASLAAYAQVVPAATKVVQLVDPQYNNMVAMRMSIPANWKFAGTIVRSPGCHANGASLKFTVVSPDGSMGFSQLPGVQWSNARGIPGCPAMTLQSASDFLVNIAAPNLRPGGEVTAILPATPASAANLANLEQQRNAALNQMAAQYGKRNTSSFRAEGARIRMKYESNGRPMEAQINAATNCTDSTNPMSGRVRQCTVEAITIAHAPAGQLDALLQSSFYLNIPREAQVNPQWDQRVANESKAQFQNMMQGNANNQSNILAAGQAAGQARQQQQANYMQQQTARNQSQQNQAQAQQNLYDAHNEAEMARQGVVHGQAQQTVRYAGNQALFQDPNTGRQVVMNNDYNHQWMSGDGQSVLQTNDHSYDPNGRVGNQSWTELEPR